MASLWQKTLFYLGLVDEEEHDAVLEDPGAQSGVRTVEPPRARATRVQAPAAPAPVPSQPPRAPEPRPPGGGVVGRRVEPPSRQRRRISAEPTHAEAGVYVHSGVAEPLPPPGSQCQVIEATTFTDAQVLADHIRSGRPVVLDLRTTEPAMVRRLVDFATGLTYALGGRMAKTAQGVILVTPHGGHLDTAEQQRLAEHGLYQAAG